MMTRRITIAALIAVLTISILTHPLSAVGANEAGERIAPSVNTAPKLQGAAAIAELKERNLYESFRAAIKGRTEYASFAPFLLSDQKLTASDGDAGDAFGGSVAISDTYIVVGAQVDRINGNYGQGSVYVFELQDDGTWAEVQKLTASDGGRSSFFGNRVSIDGSTIVVGSFAHSPGGVGNQGAAYVFELQGTAWVETQRLTAGDGAEGDLFGSSVAISGSTIVVGSRLDDIDINHNQGSAYVFERRGGAWIEAQRLTAGDGNAFAEFGHAVAINGATIVVGSPLDKINGNLQQGSAYIFTRRKGTWTETQKLTAGDGVAGGWFGYSIAIGGSAIAIGSPQGVYVFGQHMGSWSETQKLSVNGLSIAIGGGTIVASGRVFNRQSGSWIEMLKLTASDGTVFEQSGSSVAISGSTIVFGVVGSGFLSIGSAYVLTP